MDTKLKKTHKKLKVLLILLTIIVPALVLVGFYPRLERLANEKLKETSDEELRYVLDGEFIMDALEFSSYSYTKYAYENGIVSEDDYVVELGELYNDTLITDDIYVSYMYYIDDEEKYYIYPGSNQSEDYAIDIIAQKIFDEGYVLSHEDMQAMELAGYYYLEYNEYGLREKNDIVTYDLEWGFNDAWINFVDVPGLIPENMKVVFFLPYESEYIYNYSVYDWYNEEQAYWEIGAPILIIVAAILVALVALLLPFIKSLNTGNEKLFRIPAEIIIGMGIAVVLAMCGMFFAMSCTNLRWLSEQMDGNLIYILGYEIGANVIYAALLIANVIAWILCFFAEYIVVSALRQFVAHPIKYIKERFLIVRIARKIFKWIKAKVKKLWEKSKEIVSSLQPNKLLVLVLAVNLVAAIIACVFWVGGIPLFIIYTVAAYLLVYNKYMRAKEQFDTIKYAVHKMAEGDFNIHIDEDLGVFQPITDELVKVKDGFEKALIEEAKSERMRTELITNVSHDLKTPLTAIITYVDLLKKEDITDEERKQYVATLDMKSQRLKVLIEDLFEVSKANSGNVQMNLMDVDVVGLLKQVRLELEDKIVDSNVDFRWNLPNEKVVLKLDGQKTYRIFANLINNITKYSLSGSRAFVDVTANGKKVIITFKNISATEIDCDVENLTERFVRGDASRNSEGSGLGLAIVKSFVELQGGSFKIDVDGDLFKAVIEWSK